MTTRKHSRKKRKQKGIQWFYITAAGLVSAVIIAAVLLKIRADNTDSQRLAGTRASQEIDGAGQQDSAGQTDSLTPAEETGSTGPYHEPDSTDTAKIQAIISRMTLEQ